MSESKHTPGPWFVGAQNDALYIIDRRPAHDNDYPNHHADVGCIAKVYDDIRDAEIGRANAALIARAPDLAAEVERLKAEAADNEATMRAAYENACAHRAAVVQELAAERRKVEALRDLWPVIEHAMAGLVFTGDKAGEVAAQMAAARAALASTEGAAK